MSTLTDTSAGPQASTLLGAWDEAPGATPRGTLLVVPGRGEGRAQYERFGRRLAADSWRVRLLAFDAADPDATREPVRAVLDDPTLVAPSVLVGVDAAAPWVSRVADELGTDAVVLAGATAPDSTPVQDWDAELEARTACPLHRGVLTDDPTFTRGALGAPVHPEWASVVAPQQPTLVLHGEADTVTPLASAAAPFAGTPHRVAVVTGGRHDVLNDAAHRSVAATLVLFLESLRVGRDLPVLVGALPRELSQAGGTP